MTERFAVVHAAEGVFVGVTLGLAFFSAHDAVGQWLVPVSDTEVEAREVIAHLSAVDVADSAQWTVVAVQCIGRHHATVFELEAAGVAPHLLASMFENEITARRVAGADMTQSPTSSKLQ